ncbi:MAG: family 78 glycoside hydrolase catalytic domain [Clostridia bacterium]|nr:family 78 glycoside hydrolase catalytic domain [Clostridia bacterium]
MKAQRLKINYRTAPLGIDDATLRITWNCQGGVRQTAYEIEAGSYHSGKVASSDMNALLPLTPAARERVTVRVRLWDETDTPGDWAETCFERGLPAAKWHAKWIGTGRKAGKDRLPAEYFRKTFSAKSAVVCARLYATACGSYTASLNGVKLPGVLAPGSTEYGKRLYYQTYDVTALLEQENTLVFTLTDGWYMSKLGFLGQHNRFGNQRKLLCCLVMAYADGTQDTIVSDETFTCACDGPIRYADLKDGEVFDARMTPSFTEPVKVLTHSVVPTASPLEPIQEHERFSATLLQTPSGKTVLDFGQNMAGYVSFIDRGRAGDVIRLQLGEVLDHGEFSRETLLQEGTPEIRQEIVYTSDGKGGTFRPEGFYSGFRYALVEAPYAIDPQDFTAIAVYSALDFTGSFECSNLLLNRFHQNTLWSLKSNFVDVPTDCPQREKSGWDGDAQVFLPTAAYMTDPAAFFRKWLRDLRDCQRKDGRVANVSPSVHPFQDREPLSGAVGWADAAVIIPYTVWKLYGDERFLSDNLDLMRGWANYVKKAAKNKTLKRLSIFPPANKMFGPYYVSKSPLEQYVIESGQHWGEWLEPDADSIGEMRQPKPELTSAYTAYSMRLFAEMLDALGLMDEANDARAFSDGAKRAYNRYFVKDGHINAPRQAPMVRALALGLLDGEDKASVAADLNRSAIERSYTVGTGFLSTPFVLGVLTENGYLDTAYKMLENTTAPGWLAMVTGGATTVWENYVMFDENGHPKRSSMNHYSPGAVCAFLYNTVCGIRVAGKNRFAIAPQPGGTLSHAKAVYNSPFGTVESAWTRTGTQTRFTISVPANTTAAVVLPDGTTHEINAGRYEYVL